MQRLIIASVVLLSLVGTSYAFRCYACTSNQDSCGNPLASMEQECGAGVQNCYKTTVSMSGNVLGISRGCGRPSGTEQMTLNTNECKDVDITGVKTGVCMCSTKDLCNSAGSSKISLMATGISVLLAMILTKFL